MQAADWAHLLAEPVDEVAAGSTGSGFDILARCSMRDSMPLSWKERLFCLWVSTALSMSLGPGRLLTLFNSEGGCRLFAAAANGVYCGDVGEA